MDSNAKKNVPVPTIVKRGDGVPIVPAPAKPAVLKKVLYPSRMGRKYKVGENVPSEAEEDEYDDWDDDEEEDDDSEWDIGAGDPDEDDDLNIPPEERELRVPYDDLTAGQLKSAIERDQKAGKKGVPKVDDMMKLEVYGMLDMNMTPDEIREEMNISKRTMGYLMSLRKKDNLKLGGYEPTIPDPLDIYNPQPVQQPAQPPPQQNALAVSPAQPSQPPYAPPPDQTMVDKMFTMMQNAAAVAERRVYQSQATNNRLMMAMIKDKGGSGDSFFGGEVGNIIKTKMLTSALGLGPSGQSSEFMQAFQILMTSGQLQNLATQGIGLARDYMNKDNPDYDPFDEEHMKEGETIINEEQFVKQFLTRFPKTPRDIAETSTMLIFENFPNKSAQEKSKMMIDVIRAVNNFQDACLSLKTLVIQGRKTPREAAIWVRNNAPKYVKPLSQLNLDKMLEEAEPYRGTVTLGKFIRFIENPKVKPVVEEFLKYIRNPKLQENEPEPYQPPPAAEGAIEDERPVEERRADEAEADAKDAEEQLFDNMELEPDDEGEGAD